MMIFKKMSLKDAKELYKKLCEVASTNTITKICIDDLCFFTDGFTKDYGLIKRGGDLKDDNS